MAKPNELASELAAVLQEYSEEVAQAVKEECLQVAKETAAELRTTSPKRSGKYAKGWKTRVAYERGGDIRVQVYNGPKPQLAHLLEFGHVTRNGTGREYKRTPAHPHIKAAEDNAAKKLTNGVKTRLTRR